MQKRISGIYQIRNITDGKLYVGSSIDIYGRFKAHRVSLRRNKHHSPILQRAWDLHGADNFVFEIVELMEDDNIVILHEREQFFMDTLNSSYNIRKKVTDISRTRPSEETRQKISETARNISDETRQKMRDAKLGYKASNETRQKMRDAKLGIAKRPESTARMIEVRCANRLAKISQIAVPLSSKGKQPFRKLTNDQILDIRKSKETDLSLSYKYHCSASNVRKIRLRKTYKDI